MPKFLRKRVKTAHHVESPFATLPDELLINIFQHVDSVTQWNMYSVCHLWRSLLRDTAALRDYIKVDVSILPVGSQLERRQMELREWERDSLLYVTVRFLLEKHTAAHTLHIVKTTGTLARRTRLGSGDDAKRNSDAINLLRSWDTLPDFGRPSDRTIQCVVLEKLHLDADFLLRFQRSVLSWVKSVVLRAVYVNNWSIPQMDFEILRGDTGPLVPGLQRVVSCTVSDKAIPCSIVMAAIDRTEPPLDVVEEERYREVILALEQKSDGVPRTGRVVVKHVHLLVELLTATSITKVKVERAAVVDGTGVSAFWKRLIIAAKDWLAW